MDSFVYKFIRWLRLREVMRHIPRGGVVCDIGCGRDMRFLKDIADSISYGIGIDKLAENRRNEKLESVKFEILDKLPLPSDSVDAITLLAVLEHLEKPREILNECKRVLKDGGVLLMTVPTPAAKPIIEFLAFRLRLTDADEIREHKNYFWLKNLKEMLKGAGFEGQNIRGRYFELGLNSFIIAKK